MPNVNGSSDDFGNGDGHGGESSGDWADEMIGQAHPHERRNHEGFDCSSIKELHELG